MKFASAEHQAAIHSLTPYPSDGTWAYGERVWRAGQRRLELRDDWYEVKVQIMYRINLAKYLEHNDLVRDLISTGSAVLDGRPSTDCWQY